VLIALHVIFHEIFAKILVWNLLSINLSYQNCQVKNSEVKINDMWEGLDDLDHLAVNYDLEEYLWWDTMNKDVKEISSFKTLKNLPQNKSQTCSNVV